MIQPFELGTDDIAATVTQLPKGFTGAGVNCGVRKYRPDLGLIVSDFDCAASGVFTKNKIKGASLLDAMSKLPGQKIRAIVTTSGQANTATGEGGVQDNKRMVDEVAQLVDVSPGQVLSASTGVIGVPLEIEKICRAMPELKSRLTTSANQFATAILTTDLVPKMVSTEIVLSEGTVRLTGICKGSGMIHPNMATMLGYFLTDAKMEPGLVDQLLKESTNDSFNMISVDGETSTNDSVFFLANGASEVELKDPKDIEVFREKLMQMSKFLAQSIARDGEGATRLIQFKLNGVVDNDESRRLARSLSISPLIKTAINGCDPNWGRIVARLGMEGIEANAILEVQVQGMTVWSRGEGIQFDDAELSRQMRSDSVTIDIQLNLGADSITAWSCDYSVKYIEINADYRT